MAPEPTGMRMEVVKAFSAFVYDEDRLQSQLGPAVQRQWLISHWPKWDGGGWWCMFALDDVLPVAYLRLTPGEGVSVTLRQRDQSLPEERLVAQTSATSPSELYALLWSLFGRQLVEHLKHVTRKETHGTQ